MPIKGLSDQRRLPRAGKIHLGIKKISQRGNPYPSATDYFVVNEDQSTVKDAAAAFLKAYPGQPRELDIYFPHLGLPFEATKEMIFPQYYKQYGKSTGLRCKGDGNRAVRWNVNEATGEISKMDLACPGPETCPHVKRMSDGSGGVKGDCGPIAHLQVLLPKVSYLGVWQIDTGSIHSIIQVNSDLSLINGAAGRITNIPLKLRLVPREVSPGGKKKTVYTMTISFTGSMQELARFRTGNVDINPALLGEIDDAEIPSDQRPPELLQPHPLARHLPAPAAPQAAPPPAQRTASAAPAGPARLPHFESAFGPEPEKGALGPADAAAPELLDDPVESGIRFHAWRIGMTEQQREKARPLHRDPSKFLSALQKQQPNAIRVQELHAMGYGPNGFHLETGDPGGPHVQPPGGAR